MKRCAAPEFAAVENGVPSKVRAEEANITREDDREEFRSSTKFSSVKIRLLKKGCAAKANVFRENGSPEIRDTTKNEVSEIGFRKDESLKIQIHRSR